MNETTLPDTQKKGAAITSLVLGIVSLVFFWTCLLGFACGIPAVILGHIALNRVKKDPAQFAGQGPAIAGLVLGYVSLLLCLLIMPALLLPALSRAKSRAAEVTSINNLKQIGLAFRMWESGHNNQYPCNVAQAQGGTRELCQPDSNGYDQNPVPTLKVLANELGGDPKRLVCPNDPVHHAAASMASLTADNLSYQLRSGPNISDSHPAEVLMVDPINGLALLCDGSVQRDPKYKQKN